MQECLSSMPSTWAIFQTPTPLTPPTSLATAVALGLTLSAATISARFSGATRLLQPRAAIPAVSSIPAFLAIFQTPAALTPPISLATAVALELTLSAVMTCCRFSSESFFWHGRVTGLGLRNTLQLHRRPMNALDSESKTPLGFDFLKRRTTFRTFRQPDVRPSMAHS